MSDNILIHKINEQKETVKAEAIQEILPSLISSMDCKTMEEIKEAGCMIYRSPILSDKKEDPLIEVVWIGHTKNSEGYNVRGGLMEEEYFGSAFKIIISSEAIIGSAPARNIYSGVKAEIYKISRDNLIDTLYENLFSIKQEKEE